MTDWLPFARPDRDFEPEHTTFVDPRRDLATVRRRWEVRSAQWRAASIAEAVFGTPVRVRMSGGDPGGRGAFRGLLRLEVPFDDLELHRWREGVFRACAARDEVLARVPLVYVFAADAAAGGGRPSDEAAGVAGPDGREAA